MLSTAIILALFLIGIAALASAFLTSRATNRGLAQRVDLVAPMHTAHAHGGLADELAQTKADANLILRRIFGFGMKQRWALRSSGLTLLVAAVASMTSMLFLASWIPGPLNWIGLTLGIAAFFLVPQLLLRMEQAHIDQQFIEGFPDAIDMIVRMLRAGLPVTATIRTAANEAAPPVNLAFAELANQMDIGIPFEDALRATAERIALGDFRYFSVAASLQRTTGGNLAATLEILSDIIRRKRAGRLKAKAVTAEVRMTAIVLGCLPIFIVGTLMIMRPGYLMPLITDPRGNVIAIVAIGLLLLAFLVIHQMMRSVTRPQ